MSFENKGQRRPSGSIVGLLSLFLKHRVEVYITLEITGSERGINGKTKKKKKKRISLRILL